ncbi:hypothetical protein A2769_01800 [Candidatus Daviesbacteria bacterium RIFCSPHIGHO2_01_FULL_37_27]|nr:MAG: hypothetical protein A2769_01800 [Candidatus Daviesbacteria bacterium RIFCSPHIGHO2_01_FULL_37_27]OGE45339.1 MAG: hypothetical protein A3B39_01340 [Candidatus Daviesbacteria bacterium RIFCSPLOWO2_01_FULL_37_10]
MAAQKGSPRFGEAGYIQILIIGSIIVLVAGLSAGIYLIKHQTNIEPKAEELVQPNRNITGNFAAPPNIQPSPSFQIPKFIADLIPVNIPTPQPAVQLDLISTSGTPITPTTTVALTATPVPTLIPTIFPTSTPTPTSALALTPTIVPTIANRAVGNQADTSILSPTPITISYEVRYRVSFDPNFSTLIDTGDGGIFGADSEKIVSITLTGNPGQKYVYIQFYENGSWVPVTPIVASINLLSEIPGTDSAPTSTTSPTQTQPTATSTPVPTAQPIADSDGDGYPNSGDCGPNNRDVHPNQTMYFNVPYTNNNGQSSFDYDCNGAQTSPDSQDSVTTLPAGGCYTSRPSGDQGWVGSLPACGQQVIHRRCNGNDGLSCSGTQASYSRIDCPDASSTVKSWFVRDDSYGARSCR